MGAGHWAFHFPPSGSKAILQGGPLFRGQTNRATFAEGAANVAALAGTKSDLAPMAQAASAMLLPCMVSASP